MTVTWICIKCQKHLDIETSGGKPVKCSCGSYRFKKAIKVGKFLDKKPKGVEK